VFIFIYFIYGLANNVYITSDPTEKFKNLATVLTGASIFIGIFYTIINYEHNHKKNITDISEKRKHNAFMAAFEWHKPNIVEHLKVTKEMYTANKSLIDESKSGEFYNKLEEDPKARAALVSIFNYLESIAIGCKHDIMDEKFVKDFFNTLFIEYFNDYGFYIEFRRKKTGSNDIWVNFTNLAEKFKKNE
jgi:hypothetical protein